MKDHNCVCNDRMNNCECDGKCEECPKSGAKYNETLKNLRSQLSMHDGVDYSVKDIQTIWNSFVSKLSPQSGAVSTWHVFQGICFRIKTSPKHVITGLRNEPPTEQNPPNFWIGNKPHGNKPTLKYTHNDINSTQPPRSPPPPPPPEINPTRS